MVDKKKIANNISLINTEIATQKTFDHLSSNKIQKFKKQQWKY